MGRFFNEQLKSLHKIPDTKTLERMRKEFNSDRVIHSESAETNGVTLGDGGNDTEPEPAVLLANDGEVSIRPIREKRTRKTRRNKGISHQ